MAELHEDSGETLQGLQSVPRGFLRLLIVRLLNQKEMSGMDITDALEERTQGKWRPSPGSVYPMLASLKDEGLIETATTDGRSSTYRLSGKGKERFKNLIRKKHELEMRTGLHRLLWLDLLEPSERAQLHMNAASFAAKGLTEDAMLLGRSQRQKLAVKLEKTIEDLRQLVDTLKSGEIDHD